MIIQERIVASAVDTEVTDIFRKYISLYASCNVVLRILLPIVEQVSYRTWIVDSNSRSG
jgi:hypothetical protein